MKMASLYKTIHYIILLETEAYISYIAVAIYLQRLYNKSLDLGIAYKKGC